MLEPVARAGSLDGFKDRDVLEPLEPVFETVRKTRAALAPDKALIGFAGAPWTVATYMLAGGSVRDPATLREWYYREPDFLMGLIDLLTGRAVEYLIAQIDAGVDAVQLFDSWAGGLPWPVLDAVSIRPLDKIASAVKKARPDAPVILFPKGVGEKTAEYALLKDCDAVGIDYSLDPAFAREKLSPRVVVQGRLDPLLVVEGGEMMEKAARNYLKLFHDVPYVFNLGHGLTPKTPPEHVARLVEIVREGL